MKKYSLTFNTGDPQSIAYFRAKTKISVRTV
jgi:hypothetical protein